MKTEIILNQEDISELLNDPKFRPLMLERTGFKTNSDVSFSFKDSDNNPMKESNSDLNSETDPDIEKMDQSSSKYLLKKSGIVNLLKKALKNIGKESRFPSNAEEICLKSIEHILSSKKNKKTFEDFIKDPNFILFSNIWQDIHTDIEKSLCE